MSQIRGKNTKPEILVRRCLFKNGFRFRLHVKNLPGKPDIVLNKFKLAIFVHGCFWHGHTGCKYFKVPSTRREWWSAKILKTKEIDKENMQKLQELGWTAIEIWECELRTSTRDNNIERMVNTINSIKKNIA